jgi:uncharacterized protein YndB with AHSA1/START domain
MIVSFSDGRSGPGREEEMVKQRFQVKINAAREKVWETMLGKPTYEQWTKAFSPNSTFVGDWSEGSSMRFWDPGLGGGTKALLEKVEPFKLLRMRHVAMIAANGSEDVESPGAKNWIGALEQYRFSESKGVTLLTVDIEAHEDYSAELADGWNQALKLLKGLCEANP